MESAVCFPYLRSNPITYTLGGPLRKNWLREEYSAVSVFTLVERSRRYTDRWRLVELHDLTGMEESFWSNSTGEHKNVKTQHFYHCLMYLRNSYHSAKYIWWVLLSLLLWKKNVQ